MKQNTGNNTSRDTDKPDRLTVVLSSVRIDRPTRRLANIRAAENEIRVGFAIRTFLRAWTAGDPRAQEIIEDAIQARRAKAKQ